MNPRTVLVYVGMVVFTGAFAYGSIWPFINAWGIHETPAYIASSTWVIKSPKVEEITGGHRTLDTDWFPKGGSKDGHARFEHKLIGDKLKVDIQVILEEDAGKWVVKKAAYETPAGDWQEFPVE